MWYTHFLTEMLGSALLILKGTKAQGSNFLFVALGWGFAVAVAALVASVLGGKAHLNPAITLAFMVDNWKDNVGDWSLLPAYLGGQAIGMQILVDLVYSQQIVSYFKSTNEAFELNGNRAVLGMHATVPQTRKIWSNFLMEFLGTAVLTLGVLLTTKMTMAPEVGVIVVPMIVMVILMAIGTALSGTTGYAINPFRDLMPRIVYQVLILMPFANKNEGADWKYSWIPVVAPLAAGATVGAFFLI